MTFIHERFSRRHAVIGAALACSLPPLALAQPTEDDTAPVGEAFQLRGPQVQLELELRAQRAEGQDGPDRTERDLGRSRVGLGIDVRQALSERLEARAELLLRAERGSESGVLDDDEEQSIQLRRLHLDADLGASRLRAGRQALEDDGGFYIDTDVDGLRWTLDGDTRSLDVALSREAPFLDGNAQSQNTLNALVAVEFELGKRQRWTPFVLYRSGDGEDGEDDADIAWYGVQGSGRIAGDARYWANAGGRRGEIRRDDGETRQLGGFALDTGLTWVFDTRAEPSLTLGFAHATGDDIPADGDDGHRQSGLHANRNRFNGEFDFRHLGEVLDPELANIGILTLGAGVRIGKDASVDLVYHAYRQTEADDNLRGADIEFDPTGDSDDLGQGVDLIVGYDNGEALEVQAIAGLFQPGDAFADGTDDAWLVRLEIEYRFDVLDH